ncbi:DsbA family protein [Motilibacter peucedani]|nr:DsbA family protein [Motilibacter peucedani]
MPSDVPHVLGDPAAPVTVCEFGDYECPYCGAAAPVLRALVEQSEGRVRLLWRNFPLFDVHPHALTAALAVESTAETSEEAFWAMHRLVFEKQSRLDDAALQDYAARVGADPSIATGEPAQRFAGRVREDYEAGIAMGVQATPTLFVDGRTYAGRVELGALKKATGLPSSSGGRRPWQRGQ